MGGIDANGLYPYAGTSGYARGSVASEDRARTEDADGTTSARQRAVLAYVGFRGAHGATWREVANALELHHGQASAALSVLHKEERLVRLVERRGGRSQIYVTPGFVLDRDTAPHKSRLGVDDLPADDPRRWWGPEPDHDDGAPTFKACPAHRDLLRTLEPFAVAFAAARACPDCQTWGDLS